MGADVTLNGAEVKSLSISHGQLTIVLRRAVSSLTITTQNTRGPAHGHSRADEQPENLIPPPR
jgi:hypothetical protein